MVAIAAVTQRRMSAALAQGIVLLQGALQRRIVMDGAIHFRQDHADADQHQGDADHQRDFLAAEAETAAAVVGVANQRQQADAEQNTA